MTSIVADKLRNGFASLSKAEKAVANYMLTNLKSLPYETAASIAERSGVSSMTVSRFLRGLGYKGLAELKEQLRNEVDAAPLLISDRLERMRKISKRDRKLKDNFDLEVMATLGVYELLGSDPWKQAVALLVESSHVFVVGFQTIGGIASDLVFRLEYMRPGARYLDGRNGTFGELLVDEAPSPCLVLFEMRRYTKASLEIAAAAREAKIPLIIICDAHCYWAHDYTDMVLAVSTQSLLFWDNQAPFLTLSNLLLDSVISRLGDAIQPRLRKLRRLQDRFGAFHD